MLVAYIFYRLLLVIKGTRAVQVVFGLAVLIFATFVSTKVLHLATLGWLLERFWEGSLIILVVVFQPEIRSALAQLGSHKWGRVLLSEEKDFLKELIEGIRECSNRRLGALIVIEQETGLKTYIETGVLLNADLSKELILSIFNTKSPLHDGAIIIRDEKAVAARCLLPLTHEPIFLDGHGTRHRAAVGLSEISDAIVIVVSEETGKVSFVTEGKLEFNVEADELKKRVLEIYRKEKEMLF